MNKRTLAFLVAGMVAMSGSSTARTTQPANSGLFVLGVIEIPALFGLWDWDTQSLRTPPSGFVSLYAEHNGSVPFARVATPHDIEIREFQYERDAAIVYEIKPEAYRLRLSDGRYGWIRAQGAARFTH